MSILDNVTWGRCDDSLRRHDPFSPPPLSVYADVRETPEFRPVPDGAYQDRYVMKLTLVSSFWANPAQVEHHRKSAMHMLAAELYRDVHLRLDRLTHYITEGSRDEALRTIGELRKAITP